MKNEIEILGELVEINDITNIESWMEAIKPFIQEIVDDSYYSPFEYLDDEFIKTNQCFIAKEVKELIKVHRDDEGKGLSWESRVTNCIVDLYTTQQMEHGSDGFEYKTDNLYESLDQAIMDVDAPIDIDELHDRIIEKIEEALSKDNNDHPFFNVNKAVIEFRFIAGNNPFDKNHHSDSFYLSDNSLHSPGLGEISLFTLLRTSPFEFDSFKNVDRSPNELMEWMKVDRHIKSLPQPENKMDINDLNSIVEEALDSDGVPCWFGEIRLKDLLICDPSKPLVIKGGLIGIHDDARGAGFMLSLDDEMEITIGKDDYLLEPPDGYSIDSIFGFSSSAYKSSMKSVDDIIAPKAKLVRPSMGLD